MSTETWEAIQTIDLTGFDVAARDGAIGRVDGATNEVDASYIVVDAALQRVLLPAGLITGVDPKARTVTLSCSMAEVRGAPRFDGQQGFTALDRQPVETEAAPRAGEPTKQELYEDARRFGVEGRSRMSKHELVEAIERAQGRGSGQDDPETASPIEVQAFLEGIDYPASKQTLLNSVRRRQPSEQVRTTIERLPDRRFEDPTDVSRAIGEIY
jgi:hypothetical protein